MDLLRRLYGPVVVETTIDAPPSAVYEVLSDPTTYPDWLVGAARMRSVDEGFPSPGSRFEHSVGAGGPLTVDDETEALEDDPGRHLELLVHVGPFEAVVDFDLAPTPTGTVVTFSERPTGVFAPLTPLLRPTLHGRNAASLSKLRSLVTSGLVA